MCFHFTKKLKYLSSKYLVYAIWYIHVTFWIFGILLIYKVLFLYMKDFILFMYNFYLLLSLSNKWLWNDCFTPIKNFKIPFFYIHVKNIKIVLSSGIKPIIFSNKQHFIIIIDKSHFSYFTYNIYVNQTLT